MSGVSVTEGGPPIDIRAILEGGPHLQGRIDQLKAAHDKANDRLALAEQAEARADAIINEAKMMASEIIAAAQAMADQLIADAQARRKAFDDDLAAVQGQPCGTGRHGCKGRRMSLPGINYAKKPYVDIGDALPQIGDRVVYLPFTDGTHIEGTVTAIDVPSRRVQIDGIKSCHGVQESLTGVWIPWRDLAVVCP